MAEPYLQRLSQLIDGLDRSKMAAVALEARHFFSGAALYANGKICGLYSSTGLALKLPKEMKQTMINEGKGDAYRFFPNGPIKREYVLVPEVVIAERKEIQALIKAAAMYKTNRDIPEDH